MRSFDTGATRNLEEGKPDYEGFLSPLVMVAFGRYMNLNRVLPDGAKRDSDNWQLGIPMDAYMKSGWRHMIDLWLHHRNYPNLAREGVVFACCAVLFNIQGYLHEYLKKHPNALDSVEAKPDVR